MTEVEKQEGQKTVVAFVTGLLIGGLLVWVFSSTPETKDMAKEKTETETEQTMQGENKEADIKSETSAVKGEAIIGKGSLTIADQKAGNTVAIEKVEFPSKNGWVVVRDYTDGMVGNVLGAARFGVDDGLVPTSVDLMRGTVAGKSYQVTFFTNDGDKGFSLAEDKRIEGGEAIFKAN